MVYYFFKLFNFKAKAIQKLTVSLKRKAKYRNLKSTDWIGLKIRTKRAKSNKNNRKLENGYGNVNWGPALIIKITITACKFALYAHKTKLAKKRPVKFFAFNALLNGYTRYFVIGNTHFPINLLILYNASKILRRRAKHLQLFAFAFAKIFVLIKARIMETKA
ncbi:hypothetical protein GGTG_03323 [Gaeumannomyces tritici R3-111a-1]|uniref:Uncharacterized protein n=1 Tax=Gaeumannomyces tritici (strain R3-111a-1) TaxID=644352 RepID=J3NPW6_GAET3|nr:hypothetical protein GGTG_03323 [Gaeumannomyces tritici R3-111a-1]EJT78221.1 hypothetical protein GGTG_03323 [Gaeumannomyces tritici R3-111a-1]